jgi:hypothetical protein
MVQRRVRLEVKMIPTMQLRWVETDACFEEKTPVAMLPGYPECGSTYFKLQQRWIGETKDDPAEEWRDVKIG